MKHFFLIGIFLFIFAQLPGQESTIKPEVLKPAYFEKTDPLKKLQSPPPNKYISTKDIWNLTETEIHGFENRAPFIVDPVLQNFNGTGDPARVLIRENVMSNPGYGVPPDPQGAVGPDHYFLSINVSFSVLDKSGKTLYGPVENMTLWQNFPHINMTHGDPITIYDQHANRWLTSVMASINGGPIYYELIAVSETADPLGSWYTYAYELEGLPDYPKFGLWHNGYYWAGNIYNLQTNDWIGAAAFVMDREAMLSGDPDAMMLRFQTTPSNNMMQGPFSFLPSNINGEFQSTSIPNYFLYVKDDTWGFQNDHISIWECIVDWEDTASCSFTETAQLQTESFDANFNNFTYITQPNSSYNLQSLGNRLMYRLEFRHFDDYDVMVTNHTVDCDATDHAGVRWYEFRNYGDAWMIYQQGTYAPDSDHRWMGSMSVDQEGNIALGYSVSSSSTHPSVRATGRRAGDTLGIMTVPEFSIMEGEGSQTWLSNRWGDYTCMSLDPVDQSSFWYINQYYPYDHDYKWNMALGGFYFSNDSGMHTQVDPDTLFFLTAQQMSEGLDLQLSNPNSLNASVIYNDPYGSVWGSNISWFVNTYLQAPYFINAADTHVFNIRAATTDQSIRGQFFYDTMQIITSLDTHNVVLAFADSLVVSTRENDISSVSDLKVFPNPARGKLNISFSLMGNSEAQVSISDLQGQKIKDISSGMLMPGEHDFQVDINEGFVRGVYIVLVRTPKSILSEKVIVL